MTKTVENDADSRRPRVLIVGGGFGGVSAARQLKSTHAAIGLIDRQNYHLFQPLLYQVATAALNPSDIASPIRKIFRKQKNIVIGMGTVKSVDLAEQRLQVNDTYLPFDYLVLAAGATHSYFGNDGWKSDAPGLKTIDDATDIRRRFLQAFEAAEVETDPDARRAALTFVVVGGGPTGCELAGAMAEIARKTIPSDFRNIDTTTARIILVQGADRVLPGMSEESSASALRQLEALGVEVRLDQRVSEIDSKGVKCGEDFIPARCVLWAAGVQASPLGESLGVELDQSGRILVDKDLTIPGHPNVFVIGDQAAAKCSKSGKPVPGVAQGAMQGGTYAGKLIHREISAKQRGDAPPDREPFTYFDKGAMATIGKNKAVADSFGFKFSGFIAWSMWAVIHVLFLISFRNRLFVCFNWLSTYLMGTRGSRLITGKNDMSIEKPLTFETLSKESENQT
ncbi:MAG: NAD(P)/FAD-dependent oxidoreductase [Verrucomicrobiota bacterium]